MLCGTVSEVQGKNPRINATPGISMSPAEPEERRKSNASISAFVAGLLIFSLPPSIFPHLYHGSVCILPFLRCASFGSVFGLRHSCDVPFFPSQIEERSVEVEYKRKPKAPRTSEWRSKKEVAGSRYLLRKHRRSISLAFWDVVRDS